MFISKITKKGQITIPAKIRRKLNASAVEIITEGDRVILRPLRSPGGVLSRYARKKKTTEEVMEIEEKAMGEAFAEKHRSD